MIKAKSPRSGPRWIEILLSLGCSMLIATDVLTGRASILPQTAEAYYTAFKEVQAFHFWAVAVDVLILVSTLAWILLGSRPKWFLTGLAVLSSIGVLLCWSELVWAVNLRSEPVFSLRELPFRPLGNGGILGAELFGTYLLFQLPSGKMTGWQSTFLKAGLALCLWFMQMLLWDGIHRTSWGGS